MWSKNEIKIFESKTKISEYLTGDLILLSNSPLKMITIGLSGGNTPKHFFEYLVNSSYKDSINWKKIHLFWCDEHCVPPDHHDSNYGMTKQLLLKHISILEKNIHRIRGEYDPKTEALRYVDEITQYVPQINGIPQFTWILLGLGTDGHTASIFQNSKEIFSSDRLCEVTQHPITKQTRITMTPKLINNAERITFLVTGKDKSEIVNKILNSSEESEKYPANLIKPFNGKLEWVLDKEANESLI
jgi:6-phosphogluconolactonase